MSQDISEQSGFLEANTQGTLKRRSVAIFVTLALELALLLALLSLSQTAGDDPVPFSNLVSFDGQDAAEEPETPEDEPEDNSPPEFAQAPQAPSPQNEQPTPLEIPQDAPVPVPTPVPTTPALIPLSQDQMRSADISGTQTKPPAAKPAYGPADTGTPGDTPQIGGSGPNGEPLYAASWYREPTRGELEGYLSTASGPGWAMIICQTVANFRVEKCALMAEYPQGSKIGRSILAASWQFRVRPPRIGGRPQVGTWVRIRIDYTQRR